MRSFKLKTEVKISKLDSLCGPETVVAGIGSCFAQDMLDRLFSAGFKGMSNPNGIVYNAVSIAETIARAVDNVPYCADDFFEFNGKWRSWGHHGSFADASRENAVSKANESTRAFRDILARCDLFVFTPSSSVVYEHMPEKRIVANCHKVPNKEFNRRLLSVDENFAALSGSMEKIMDFNPGCRVLVTLSPVRHYPGELPLNARSKAQLLSAIGMCLDKFAALSYFPSYEILTDELRDYRFYKDDMLHPSELARSIIFEKFLDAFFADSAKEKIALEQKRLNLQNHIQK